LASKKFVLVLIGQKLKGGVGAAHSR